MSEQENVDNVDNIEEIQPIETPTKIKTYNIRRIITIKTSKNKSTRNETIKTKAKKLPIEEVKLNALKYDQLQKTKRRINKPKVIIYGSAISFMN